MLLRTSLWQIISERAAEPKSSTSTRVRRFNIEIYIKSYCFFFLLRYNENTVFLKDPFKLTVTEVFLQQGHVQFLHIKRGEKKLEKMAEVAIYL